MSMQEWLQIIAACIGSLGFAFLFNVRGLRLIVTAIGGLLSWLIFLLSHRYLSSEPVCYFLSATIVTLYAEWMARLIKTHTTTFITASLVPLVPGGSLYYTMAYALQEHQLFVGSAVHTLQLAAALSLGIVLVTALMRSIRDFKNKYHNH